MAFEELERGDVVWGIDPLSEKGRPMCVLGAPRFREHGVQRSTVLRSTKTYHEDALSRRDDDYDGDPLGEQVTSVHGRSRRATVLWTSSTI